jgi:hypothetical protein
MLSNLAVSRAAAEQLEHLAGSGAADSLAQALNEFEREVGGLLPEMETLA